MTQGFCGFLLVLGGEEGCGEGAGCMTGASPGFMVLGFLSANQNENQHI